MNELLIKACDPQLPQEKQILRMTLQLNLLDAAVELVGFLVARILFQGSPVDVADE